MFIAGHLDRSHPIRNSSRRLAQRKWALRRPYPSSSPDRSAQTVRSSSLNQPTSTGSAGAAVSAIPATTFRLVIEVEASCATVTSLVRGRTLGPSKACSLFKIDHLARNGPILSASVSLFSRCSVVSRASEFLILRAVVPYVLYRGRLSPMQSRSLIRIQLISLC